jgi:hypothetical protein
MEKDIEKRIRRAMDRSRKDRGGYRNKKRSPSYSYDSRSRSYSGGGSYRRKGKRSRTPPSERKRGGSKSHSKSRSDGSYRQYSKQSPRSPRGEIQEEYPSRVLRSKSAGSHDGKPETNGHVEDKNPEAPLNTSDNKD